MALTAAAFLTTRLRTAALATAAARAPAFLGTSTDGTAARLARCLLPSLGGGPGRSSGAIAPSAAAAAALSTGPGGGGGGGGEASASRTVRVKKRRVKLIPKKYAVALTPEARSLFRSLLENAPPDVVGILLKYGQSEGSVGMAFSFGFAREDDIGEEDEGVSLETLPNGEPKPPSDAHDDGLPKLYVSSDALLKVLGCTVDVDDKDGISPLVLDGEGNQLDPNA